MKNIKSTLVIFVIFIVLFSCKDDDKPEDKYRYFRFRGCTESAHENWQDTSFIARTEDPGVITQCLDQLALPLESRAMFPFGDIERGSGGFNHNASHFFDWHFVEDSWELVEITIEIYDGCPYSDAELSDYTAIYGRYGGWSNIILEEITNP